MFGALVGLLRSSCNIIHAIKLVICFQVTAFFKHRNMVNDKIRQKTELLLETRIRTRMIHSSGVVSNGKL